MNRIQSKTSFKSRSNQNFILKDSNKQLFVQIEDTLNQANQKLQFNEFIDFYEQLVKNCIQKCQIQNNQQLFLMFLKKITKLYKPTLQIQVRILLLQASKLIQSQDIEGNLKPVTKLKYMIVDTEYQYLLSKIFLLEAKIYENAENIDLTIKTLKKCTQFSQNYAISSYFNYKENIKKQITQNLVISYFQLYNHIREIDWKQAQQYLIKAYKTLQKNLGSDNHITQLINQVYSNQKIKRNNMQKMKISQFTEQNKVQTLIFQNQIKKNFMLNGYYSWQEQRLIVQMIKIKGNQKQILQQIEYLVKLDFSKVKELKSINWAQINNGQIQIIQDQIVKVVEGNNNVTKKDNNTTRVGLKTISRQEIIKKQTLSSSSQDLSFIQKEDFNFIRNLGRAQSAKKQKQNR